ncbi:hypothetical protein AMTRI_Chr11g100260 [Amborella trichopoda]
MRGVSWKVHKQTLHYNVERACPYSRKPKSYPVACKEEDKKYIELSFTVFHGPQVQDFNGDFWLLVPTMDLPPPCHTQVGACYRRCVPQHRSRHRHNNHLGNLWPHHQHRALQLLLCRAYPHHPLRTVFLYLSYPHPNFNPFRSLPHTLPCFAGWNQSQSSPLCFRSPYHYFAPPNKGSDGPCCFFFFGIRLFCIIIL